MNTNKYILISCFLAIGMSVVTFANVGIEGATSPDKKYTIIQEENGGIYIVSQIEGKRVGVIQTPSEPPCENIVARWSSDSSRVALLFRNRRWDEVTIFQLSPQGYVPLSVQLPDPLEIYGNQKKQKSQFSNEILRVYSAVGTLGDWMRKSELVLTMSYEASNKMDTDQDRRFSIKYLLNIKEDHVIVEHPVLKIN